MTSPSRQAVILCGGLGSRLGALTRSTPKPLLPVAGRPFLSILIDELATQGVRDFLLLAAFENAQILQFADQVRNSLPTLEIQVSIEPDRAGTGGALWHGRDQLHEQFYLLNGDSWFDAPIHDLGQCLKNSPDILGALSLRSVADRSRYGAIALNGSRVREFGGRAGQVGPGLINTGVYMFRREIIEHLPQNGSLEQDVLPILARAGRLGGVEHDAYFIDIGVPDDFERAQTEIFTQRRKPTLLIDPSFTAAAEWIVAGRKNGWRVFALDMPNASSLDHSIGTMPIDQLREGVFDQRWPILSEHGLIVSDNVEVLQQCAAAGFKVVADLNSLQL